MPKNAKEIQQAFNNGVEIALSKSATISEITKALKDFQKVLKKLKKV